MPDWFSRSLLLLSLLVVLAACGSDDSPPSEDAGPADDGGQSPDGASGDDAGDDPDGGAQGPRHESYVPPDLSPEDALRIVVMGDSISTGTGATDDAHAYYGLLSVNDDEDWHGAAGSDLSSAFGHDVPVINVAVGGATTGSMLGEEDQRPLLEDALGGFPVSGHTIVVVTIGGNNVQAALLSDDPAGPPLDDALGDIRTLVEWLNDPSRFSDGVSIYVMDIYDPSDGTGHVDGCFFDLTIPQIVVALDDWREGYIELGTELGFAVIDGLGHFHGHGHNSGDPENRYYDALEPTNWFDDCVHPNDRGHHEIRRLFFEAIVPGNPVE